MNKRCIVCKGNIPDKNNFRIYCSTKCKDIKREERKSKKKILKKCKRCGRIKEQSYLFYCNECGVIKRREAKEKEKKTQQRYAKEKWKNNKDDAKWRKRQYESSKKAYMKKYRNDKDFRLTIGLRNRLHQVFKRYTQEGKIMTSKKYGIDYKAIIEHLKPFPKDIKNYDIHHVKQLSKFNFINEDGTTNIEKIQKAFSPQNHKLVTKDEHKKIHKNNK